MAVQVRRRVFDFFATDYKTSSPRVHILPEGAAPPAKVGAECVLRCYLSLLGEDRPTLSPLRVSQDDEFIYRYDWAFGISLIEGYYWNWQKELREDGALALHLVLESSEGAPEAIPVFATVSALRPSRNTKGFWETAWPRIPKAAAEMTTIGEAALPPLKYLSSSLMLVSNVLESQADKQKNWFLYQFFDEKRRAATVEWRINKNVFREYGPLLRGSLFLSFAGSKGPKSGTIRALLRPQLGYAPKDEICFVIPTNELPEDRQVSIEIKPQEA